MRLPTTSPGQHQKHIAARQKELLLELDAAKTKSLHCSSPPSADLKMILSEKRRACCIRRTTNT